MEIREKEVAVELEESSGKMRRLKGFGGTLVTGLAAGTTLFHIICLTVFPLDPWVFLSASAGLFSILTFLLFPATERGKKRIQPVDLLLSVICIAVIVYITVHYSDMYYRVGFNPTTADWIFGLAAVVMVLEMCRRLMGWFFPIICLAFVGYIVFGAGLPGIWGHRGYEFSRLISVLASTEGIYGSSMSAASTYIVLFVTFGAFLRMLGVGKFFINLAMSVAGTARGGPAKVSVFASGLFGMVSGSAMGNAVTVGTFTIPLMKHIGYRPLFAAAVEAAASTGGQIMPPVMGSVAFVLAEATMTPYRDVCIAAAIPAVCYFASVYFMIDFEAAKLGLRGLPRAELPNFWGVLREGYLFLIPIIMLVYMIVFGGYSVIMAAIASTGAAILTSWFREGSWMGWRRFVSALEEGSLGTLEAAGACAAAGIIIGVFTMTGLGSRLVALVLSFGQHSLILSLLLVMALTLFLGTGLPTVPAYILTAAVGAPVLVQLGVPQLAAHLFVMYYACVSTITPPVAFAAYAAAGIAKADPNDTGWMATRLGIVAYIIPFLFVFNPALLWKGPWYDVLSATVLGFMSAWSLAGGVNGYFHPLLRIGLLVASVILLSPRIRWEAAGIGLLFGIVLIHHLLGRGKKA